MEKGQDRCRCLNGPARGDQVAGHRFVRSGWNFKGPPAQGLLDGPRFSDIVLRGSRSMGVDAIDLIGLQVRIPKGLIRNLPIGVRT